MTGRATRNELMELLLGSSVADIAGDRRRQAAVVVWIGAAVCCAIGFAPAAGGAFSQPSSWVSPILFSIIFWIRWVLQEDRRGARAAMAIATARVGLFWAVILAFVAFARLIALVAPDDVAWIAGWWIASAALVVLGGFAWQRERRQHVALVGMCVGLMIAFGSLAGYAAGGAATVVTVIGVPVGLVLLYVSGRSAG